MQGRRDACILHTAKRMEERRDAKGDLGLGWLFSNFDVHRNLLQGLLNM